MSVILLPIATRTDQKLTVHVDKGDVGARVDHSLGNDEAQPSGTAGDETDVAVKGEGGKGRLDILAVHATNRLTARKLVLLGVLDLDARVGSGVAAGLVAARRDVVDVARGGERRPQDRRGCGRGVARGVPQRGGEGAGRHCDCDGDLRFAVFVGKAAVVRKMLQELRGRVVGKKRR